MFVLNLCMNLSTPNLFFNDNFMVAIIESLAISRHFYFFNILKTVIILLHIIIYIESFLNALGFEYLDY